MLVLENNSKLSNFWVASDSLWVEPLLSQKLPKCAQLKILPALLMNASNLSNVSNASNASNASNESNASNASKLLSNKTDI